jgi:phage I-like protein
MPYSFPDNVPDFMKNMPEGAQKIFISIFNASVKEGKSEDEARIAGWGAVKNKYERRGEEWVAKATESLHAIQLAEPTNGTVQVLRTGTFYHPLYGKFTITDETLSKMQDNFGKVRPIPPTEMVIDYDHLASDPKLPEQGKAAGWVKALRAAPGKLFATIEWTAEAAKAIREKLFRFISPEFTFDYTDKATGKKVGPVLVSACLTNRPFLEGMEPVVLSEALSSMVFAESRGTDWDDEYMDNLPDSCFAYIKPGGEKDEGGRTKPRELRMLPYKDMQGEVDQSHLRSAMSKMEQEDMSDEEKAKVRKVLESAMMGEDEDKYRENSSQHRLNKEGKLDEKKLRELLGIGEGDDVLKAVQALKDSGASLQTQLASERARADKADLKLSEAQALAVVDAALAKKKITPKMREWAATYAMKDPAGFAVYVEKAEEVGPDLNVKGHEGGGEVVSLSELEKGIAKTLHVPEEKLLAAKREDAAKK